MKSLTIKLFCSAILCHVKIALCISRFPSFIHGRSVRVGGCNNISFVKGDSRTETVSLPRTPILRTKSTSRSIILLNMDVGGGELSSALATLDREWQMTSRSSNRPTGGSAGWTKLVLRNDDVDSESESERTEASNEDEKFVYLLEPCATPSSVILFLGGAGLGQFPHIAYSQLLSKISQTLNASIIAAPYSVGLDHFELSKSTGELLRRAVVQCEELGSYSPSLPKFYLAHSLGSKLFSIALAAGGLGTDLNGVGFLAYNNFGFKDTVGMVKSFSREMRGNDGNDSTDSSFNDFVSGGGQSAMFEKVLEFAEQAVSMSGLEFTPSPSDTSRMINMKYDEELQEKTRLFVFDNDDLDSSQDFIQACQKSDTDSNNGTGKLTTSGLPGTHLTPVYLNFDLEDLPIPEEARELTGGFAGGFRGASFGDEQKMNIAADEICDWVMGKTPSRQPNYGKRDSDVNEQTWGRRISGEIIEPEVE